MSKCQIIIILTAINIVATFVHNEPTSLTTIQEAKVPETIYGALEAGLEPSIEASRIIFAAMLGCNVFFDRLSNQFPMRSVPCV